MKLALRKLLLDTLHLVPYIPADTSLVNDSALAAAMTENENLYALGYTLRPQDVILLAASPSLGSLFDDLKQCVPEMKAQPMFPDFPKQVMNMSAAQFRFHQMLHYFSTYGIEALFGIRVDKGWLPDVACTEKTREDTRLLPCKVLDLVPEQEICALAVTRLLERRERMTLSEKELVLLSLPEVSSEQLSGLTVPFKENLELLFEDILDTYSREDAIRCLSGLCQHSGDVLHNIHRLLSGHRYHLTTRYKRTLVKLLECYKIADFRANLVLSGTGREKNLVILDHLDYNKYSRSAAHREAVAALRDGTLVSWESRARRLLEQKADNALSFASARPGYVLRMLSWLLTLGYSEDDILQALIPQAGRFSMRTLIRVFSLSQSEREKTAAEEKDRELEKIRLAYQDKLRRFNIESIRQKHLYELNLMQCHLKNRMGTINNQTQKKLAALSEEAIAARLKAELDQIYSPMQSEIDLVRSGYLPILAQLERFIAETEKKIRRYHASVSRLNKFLEDTSISHSDRDYLTLRITCTKRQICRLNKKLNRAKTKSHAAQQEMAAIENRIRSEIASDPEIQAAVRNAEDTAEQTRLSAATQREEIRREAERLIEEVRSDHGRQLTLCKEQYRAELEKIASGSVVKKLLQAQDKEERAALARYESRIKSLGTIPARQRIVRRLLEEQLKKVTTVIKGKKVFLDPGVFDLAHSVIEADQKSMDGSYVPSGLAFKIPEDASTVRFYVYWNDRRRVDVDLHAAAAVPGDPQGGKPVERFHIGWNGGFNEHGIIHSGDITHSDAAEYIDINLQEDALYAFLNTDLYYGRESFSDIEECFVGMMAVKELGETVELYSPANSFFTHTLRQKAHRLYYGYVDIQHRFVRFVGKPSGLGYASEPMLPNLEETLTLQDYLNMLIRMQEATLVESFEEADVVLTMEKSSDPDAISLIDEDFFLDAV